MSVEARSDISIILVSYNSAETILKSVKSLFDNAPNGKYRVVLVDNASADGSADLVSKSFPDVKIIRNEKNFGFGVANNIGMRAFPADLYYLHNIDAYLQAPVIDLASEAMKDLGFGVAGLPLVYPDGSPQSAAYSFTSPAKWLMQDLRLDGLAKIVLGLPVVGGLALRVLRQFKVSRGFSELQGGGDGSAKNVTVEPVDWVCGAAFLLTHDAFLKTGGFDPGIFLYGEDEDLCRTAKFCGIGVGQVRGVVPTVHDFGWGKSKTVNPVVVRLRRESMLYCVDKWFLKKSLSAALMRGIVNRRYSS